MFKLNRKDSVVVVIDMQERLAEIMNEEMFETVVRNIGILTKSAELMGVPVVESLQYVKGLGNRVDELSDMPKPALVVEKKAFSLCKEQKFMDYLKDNKRKSVILSGMETHICVLQTALDLIDAGYSVHIVADGVISANDFNWETGLDMAQRAGAVVTVTETVVYQLLETSEAKEFKSVQQLMKD